MVPGPVLVGRHPAPSTENGAKWLVQCGEADGVVGLMNPARSRLDPTSRILHSVRIRSGHRIFVLLLKRSGGRVYARQGVGTIKVISSISHAAQSPEPALPRTR